MTDDVWREFFDGYAPQHTNEVFTGDGAKRRSPA